MSENFNPRRELINRYKEAFVAAWTTRAKERIARRYLSTEADFLPTSLAVSERPTPIMPHIAMLLFCSLVIIALAWSVIGRIDVVVVASGKVLPGGKTKSVQSVDTQIVRRVHVHDGMHVKEGELLVQFDSSSANADLSRYLQELKRASTLQFAYKNLMQGIVKSGPPKLVTPENLNQWIDLKLAVETIETKWGEYQAKIERASADLDKRKSESESLIVNENILQGRLKRQKELENDFREPLI